MSDIKSCGTPDLPLKIGKFSAGWFALVMVLGGLFLWGVYGFYFQLRHGDIVTGARTIGQGGAAWGLYICFYVYFVGVSFAGISTAAMVRLFDIKLLKPLSRVAELVTICALLVASMLIIADLGRPLKGLTNLPAFARTMSPFFGTFTLVVAGYLFSSLVYFYLAGRADAAYCAERAGKWGWAYRIWATGFRGTANERKRHTSVSFWLSLTILPILVAAHSTLGFIFGIQGGRPGWFSALQAPGFVVMAGVSGIGVLIIVAAVVRKHFGLEEKIDKATFQWLGNLLWVLGVIYLYFMLVEELTANYAGLAGEAHVAHAVTMGAYARSFWTVVAALAIPVAILFRQFATGSVNIGLTVFCGFTVNIAAVLKRMLIVVPSQTHGMLLNYPDGHYSPTWVELSIVIGLFALAILMGVVFAKFFPIVPVETSERVAKAPEIKETGGFRWTRRLLFWGTLATGLTLALVGFACSARYGTKPYLDPIIPFAPVMFIIGVMMSFYSAAMYETVPPMKPVEKG